MLNKQAEKLLELYENGYNIHYCSGYVDGTMALTLNEYLQVVGDSSVYCNLNINELSVHSFTVTEDIDDWENFEI